MTPAATALRGTGAFLVIGLVLTACQAERLVVPPLPEDAGAPSCASAAEHIASIPCELMSRGPDGTTGTEDDLTFLEFCERLQSDEDTAGLLDLRCIVRSGSCEEVDGCGAEL